MTFGTTNLQCTSQMVCYVFTKNHIRFVLVLCVCILFPAFNMAIGGCSLAILLYVNFSVCVLCNPVVVKLCLDQSNYGRVLFVNL